MITDFWFYVAAVPAVIIVGLAKGGFAGAGTVSLPIIALTISPVQGAAILLPILMIQDAISVWAYRREWDRRNLIIMLPGGCAGVLLGYLLASKVSDETVGLAVGIISIGFGGWRLVLERILKSDRATRADILPGLFWGAVSGFTSTISHAGGPPFQVYALPQRMPRDLFVGTSVLFFAAVNWMKVAPYLLLGQFTRDNLTTSLVLFPLAIASTLAGVWLVRRIEPAKFYVAIYLLLIVVGAKLVWDGVAALV